jgi:predicted Zn-dependent protease
MFFQKKWYLLVFTVIFLSGCNTVMEMIPLDIDKTLGEQFSYQINVSTSDYPVLDPEKHKEVYAYVENIRDQLLQSDKIKYKNQFPYSVKIIQDDNTLNAFCVAGGYIYVYTGLIKYVDSESELAGVIAHEIAHAENRHTVKQLAESYGTGILISLIFGSDYRDLINLGQQLLSLKFSRGDEKEADEFAVEYLYDTNYDPRGVGGFFKKLIKEEKDHKHIPDFLSTHPASQDRIDDIDKKWKELGAKEGETGTERHKKIVQLLTTDSRAE